MADKVGLLAEWSGRLLVTEAVDHVTADVLAVTEDKYYADLAGTEATQRRVRVHPTVEAMAVDPRRGVRDHAHRGPPGRPRLGVPARARGGTGTPSWTPSPSSWRRSCAAPSVEAGNYDLVIDPTNLWLTIHESIGHATELDRAMGYEAAYAGTSFATLDQLGSLRYGSEIMQVTGDRTTPHGLATVAIDDEGVPGQSFDLVARGRPGRLPARPVHRRRQWTGSVQRLRLRRLPAAHPHPADGQRLAAAGRR